MRTKKTFVVLIAVFFAFALIFSCIILFSVKKIDVKFSVDVSTEVESVEQEIKKFSGKNLVFLSESEIKDSLKNHPYFEVTSVTKDYPNTLQVSVRERIETFYFEYDQKVYVTDQDLLLLSVKENEEDFKPKSGEILYIKLDGMDIVNAVLGEKIGTSNQEYFNGSLEMAKEIGYTECVDQMKIVCKTENNTVGFHTHTGVIVVVEKADENGLQKVKKGFDTYKQTDDYVKLYSGKYILAYKEDGKEESTAKWTPVYSNKELWSDLG